MKKLLDLLNIRQTKIRWVIAILILCGIFFIYYLLFIRDPYTIDAYVQANWVKIAARVYGPVTEIYVKNNEQVKLGQKLFQIDPTDYQLTLNQAKGQLLTIKQHLAALSKQIDQAEYMVKEKQALLVFATEQYYRYKRLASENVVPEDTYNQSQANYTSLQSQVAQAKYNVERLKAQLSLLEHNGELQTAIAKVNLAKKRLSYTTIYAPVNGTLSNFYVRVGQYISVGESVFSVVDNSYWWIQANYLEPEIERIKPGMHAAIKVSLYPSHTFQGEVTSIGPAISRGRVISPQTQLPKVAETIQWLRLFSRFPVFIQIHVKDGDPHLRVGATAAVLIRTHT